VNKFFSRKIYETQQSCSKPRKLKEQTGAGYKVGKLGSWNYKSELSELKLEVPKVNE
jgi:hypothetical protein